MFRYPDETLSLVFDMLLKNLFSPDMPRLTTIFNLSRDLVTVLQFCFLVIKLTMSLLERFSPKLNNKKKKCELSTESETTLRI